MPTNTKALQVAEPVAQVVGKNPVINGAFDIWQRGTSFTTATYTADRWFSQTSGGTTTFARESTVVPAGAQYSMKWTQATSAAYANILQAIETANALPFVGKYVTLSAQVAASTSQGVTLELYYATTTDKTISGAGWTQITASSNANFTPSSTSFISASTLFLVPSTAKSLMVAITTSSIAAGNTFYVGNIQLELGSVATPFSRAGGTIAGELAACQRYYYRRTGNGGPLTFGMAPNSTTVAQTYFQHIVPMRIPPTAIEVSGVGCSDEQSAFTTGTTTWDGSDNYATYVRYTHGSAALTAYRAYKLYLTGANSYLAVSAEL